jgi:hypothetical protein
MKNLKKLARKEKTKKNDSERRKDNEGKNMKNLKKLARKEKTKK